MERINIIYLQSNNNWFSVENMFVFNSSKFFNCELTFLNHYANSIVNHQGFRKAYEIRYDTNNDTHDTFL